MKDIGILTFHDTNNFGAILQAYATYLILTELGYAAELIDYHCDSIAMRENPLLKFSNSSSIKKRIKLWLRDFKEIRKYQELKSFLESNAAIGTVRYDKNSFSIAGSEYKAILVGSDMLWCTRFTKSDYSYMLKGIKNCKKISYATSVGYLWGKDEESEILELLGVFDLITVREDDIAAYLSDKLHRHISSVCDPTMLVNANRWRKLVNPGRESGYCLMYMDDADGNCSLNAKRYAKENHLNYRTAKYKIRGLRQNKCMELYTISDFLSAIHGASMLFTASYHGLLFSIYFHIPFVYFNKDSSRLKSLAKKLNIEYRDGDKWDLHDMKEINWEELDTKVKSYRASSIKELKDMLMIIK